MKIGCVIYNISNDEGKNFIKDDFFTPNSINSFKKFHPDIEMIFINDNNFKDYIDKLAIKEYYDQLGIIRVHLIQELMKSGLYSKIIMLGADTFTCDRLSEFIDNDTDDIICSSGPPYMFLKTDYWEPKLETFEHNKKMYQDVSFINADVVCFNSYEGIKNVYEATLNYWSTHAEQGGLNYCYINQDKLGLKVSIVDFPYVKTNILYNVRSKGPACGGGQMYDGKLYNGHYKDKNSQIIGDVYPTKLFYIKDDKLFTSDNKQIKVFHYAEALGCATTEEYNKTLWDIKNNWFNTETMEFLTKNCNCKF